MIINTSCTLYSSCCSSGSVELPIKSWDEVHEWYVKWDILHYTLDHGETWHEVELNSDIDSADQDVDWKRPSSVYITDEHNNELVST